MWSVEYQVVGGRDPGTCLSDHTLEKVMTAGQGGRLMCAT